MGTGLLTSRFQPSMLAFEHGRLQRPGRFFAVAAKENLAEAEPLQERDF